jgi:hypothetical protein
MKRKRKQIEIQKTIIKLHQHDLSNFLQCPQKYYLSNVLNRYPLGAMKAAINIGDLFAKCVYWMHKGTPLSECLTFVHKLQDEQLVKATKPEVIEELETRVVTVQAMLQGYESHFLKSDLIKVTKYNERGGIEGFNEIKIDKIIPEYTLSHQFEFGSYVFEYICRLDGKIIINNTNTNSWVLELKTAAQIDGDLLKKLNTNFQINSYWMMLELCDLTPVDGVLYRHIKKPSIKQTKKETIEQYQKRLMLDYLERPENYFHEESLYFNKPALESFKFNFQQYLQSLLMCYATNIWECRGTSCDTNFGLCQYLPYCSNPTEETLNTFFKVGE